MFRGAFFLWLLVAGLMHVSLQAAERIVLDDETLETLQRHYQRYLRKNGLEMAERELTVASSNGCSIMQNADYTRLPICEQDCRPEHWKYLSETESSERVLKYVGKSGLGANFLKWDFGWVRIAGSKERFREGMYCQKGENFALIDLDKSFSENVVYTNTRVEMVDGVLLQLSTKSVNPAPRMMSGEVKLAPIVPVTGVRVALEIWESGVDGLHLLATNWQTLNNPEGHAETLRVEGNVSADHKAIVLLRLDPSSRILLAKGETSGKVAIYEAVLRTK